MLGATLSAKISVTKTTCNYQAANAIVADSDIMLGWQMTSDTNNDCQSAYQIEVRENGTDKPILTTKKTKSGESQRVSLAAIPYSSTACKWRVRVWDIQYKPS